MGVLNWSGAISCFLALEKGNGMNKRTRPFSADRAKPYVMRIADSLSDDPVLLRLLGPRFKVFVNYDVERRRVTYSFRRVDDTEPEDLDAKQV